MNMYLNKSFIDIILSIFSYVENTTSSTCQYCWSDLIATCMCLSAQIVCPDLQDSQQGPRNYLRGKRETKRHGDEQQVCILIKLSNFIVLHTAI